MVSTEFVRSQFSVWETDDPSPWFASLPDTFDFTLAGAINPLKGKYTSKEQVFAAFGVIMSKLSGPPKVKIENILTSGDYAVVEVTRTAVSKGGVSYDEMACFVVRYEEEKMVELRVYIDTAVEKALFEESG